MSELRDEDLYDAVIQAKPWEDDDSWWEGYKTAAAVAARIAAERVTVRPKPGDTIRINRGLGEGQTTRIQGVVDLPMGLGLKVILDGDYPATLNPADVEIVSAAIEPGLPVIPEGWRLSFVEWGRYATMDYVARVERIEYADEYHQAFAPHPWDAIAAAIKAAEGEDHE